MLLLRYRKRRQGLRSVPWRSSVSLEGESRAFLMMWQPMTACLATVTRPGFTMVQFSFEQHGAAGLHNSSKLRRL
ncbi:hypothetical protein BDR03DRAFT_948818 [Suillus americanus]|nr:hypothetical protein BDR03DRAFT_948818 [Suillus americanus]